MSQTIDFVGLFLLNVGPSVYPVDRVPAGNIVGIIGLQDYVLKSATLSNSLHCRPLNNMTFQSKPMVRVAVEPRRHQDLKQFEEGLQRLYQYDPVVEIGMAGSSNGGGELRQHTITCLGELHLEQCLKSLTERFAKYVQQCL